MIADIAACREEHGWVESPCGLIRETHEEEASPLWNKIWGCTRSPSGEKKMENAIIHKFIVT